MKKIATFFLFFLPILAIAQQPYKTDDGYDPDQQPTAPAQAPAPVVVQPAQQVVIELPTQAIAKSAGNVNENVVPCKLDMNNDRKIDCVKNFFADSSVQQDIFSCIKLGKYYPVVEISFYSEVQYVNGLPVVGVITGVQMPAAQM